jgi:DNA-binding NarL/FixJ family response regulator
MTLYNDGVAYFICYIFEELAPTESPKHTKNMIEWRRNTVLSKLAKGYSQAEIAKELQLHPSTISLDVQF